MSLPENGDFVRGIVFHESLKHTLKKIIFFMSGVNPFTKTHFHETAPNTVMKSAVFVRVFRYPS